MPDESTTPDLVELQRGGSLQLPIEASYRGREGAERFAADTRENWQELQSVAEEYRYAGDR
jgi:hypothetical protein